MARTPFKLRSSGPFKMMGSSPLKQDNIKWGDEKQTSKTVTPNDRGGEDTRTTYQTEGTSYTPPNKTPEGSEAYKNMTVEQRKAADAKYIAANTQNHEKNREELNVTKNNMEEIPRLPIKPLPVEQTENLQQPKIKKYTTVVDEKPGLFNRGRVTVTNNETGKSHSSKTSSRTGEVAKKVGKFVENIIPKKGFKKRCMPNRKNGSTECTIG